MRRAALVAAVVAVLSAPFATAAADSSVTVRGLAFPSSSTYLSYFGCESLFGADNQAPQVRITKDQATPAGTRSFGLLVPGSGTASGPVHLTDSVAGTTVVGFSARAAGGSTGAAYVWYVSDELEDGEVWAGRADLSAGASWQYVDAAKASYTWQRLDAATGELVEDAGTGTMAAFTRAHGDGPGYLLAGLGCNGNEFSIDALKFGSPGAVTTYDLEGMTATAEMRAKLANGKAVKSGVEVAPGTAVTLLGTADDGTKVPVGVPMVLQASTGGGAFKDVGGAISADDDAVVRAVVKPEVTTTYRWYLPDLGYASAATSNKFTIVVLPPAGETPPPEESESPTEEPSEEPSANPDPTASETPEAEEPEVPPLPSQAPSEEPSAEPTAEPTEEAPTESTPAADPAGEPASGESTDATP